jgi:beta-glucosidase-like glycosyl hydrolase
VMSSINAVNGVPMIAHKYLLKDVLLDEFGFTGFIMSDCDPLPNVVTSWNYTSSLEQAVTLSIRSGNHLNCGPEFVLLNNATADGLASETDDIDPAVLRLLTARIKVGDLDPPGQAPYLDIPYSVVNSEPHKELARQIVRESVVLLTNDGHALPFVTASSEESDARFRMVRHDNADVECDRSVAQAKPGACLLGHKRCDVKSVPGECVLPRDEAADICKDWAECGAVVCEDAMPFCSARTWKDAGSTRSSKRHSFVKVPAAMKNLLVVGPSANDPGIGAHTYHGTPEQWVTVLDGLNMRLGGTGVNVTYVHGCNITGFDKSGFAAAVQAVAAADAILYVGGLWAYIEEEDTDRENFTLPGVQLDLIQALHAANVARETAAPMAVLIISGGPVSEPWLIEQPAISWAWVAYFGQAGDGIADVLLGNYSPSGRLPYTVPVNESQLGPISDYNMRGPPFGRTYRYLWQNVSAAFPLFPFAYGLSYSNITVTALALPQPMVTVSATAVPVIATVVNYGPVAVDFVVPVFGRFTNCDGSPSPVVAAPLRTLMGFTKLQNVPPTGEEVTATVWMNIASTPASNRQPLPGKLELWAGDAGLCEECPTATLQLSLGAKTCAAPSIKRDEL